MLLETKSGKYRGEMGVNGVSSHVFNEVNTKLNWALLLLPLQIASYHYSLFFYRK